MKPAEEKLKEDLKQVSISRPSFPIYSNFTAKTTDSPEEIRDNLVQQVCSRVRWVESIENMIKEHSPEAAYEFGYGNVISGLMKRIAPELPRFNY